MDWRRAQLKQDNEKIHPAPTISELPEPRLPTEFKDPGDVRCSLFLILIYTRKQIFKPCQKPTNTFYPVFVKLVTEQGSSIVCKPVFGLSLVQVKQRNKGA